MQVAANTSENQVVNQRQFAFGIEERNKASISLKTQEGDVVNLSFSNLNKYSESANQTTTQDGTSGEFSVAALSASNYSISVQGDLNAEEMAAIKTMADAITPIAQDFFSQTDGISLEQAAQALSASMGVIKEAEVHLRQEVTQTTTVTQSSRSGQDSSSPVPPVNVQVPENPAVNPAQPPPARQDQGIRNPEALANAVVDSAFQKTGEKDDPVLLRGLSDLMAYLKKRLQDFLEHSKQEQEKPQQISDATAKPSGTHPETPKTASESSATDKV